MWLLMHLVLGLGSPRPFLLAALLTILGSQLAGAQLSIPVTTVHDFAGALQNANVSEIILDPSGTGVNRIPSCTASQSWAQTIQSMCYIEA